MDSILEALTTIKTLLERKKNEGVLAVYDGSTHVLSQEYKNWYV